jgi:hypothetical protein
LENRISDILILDEVLPRLLGLVDRDPYSATYGSCDRNYWMYKISDFSSGILQQTSLTFALIYKNRDVLMKHRSEINNIDFDFMEYYKEISISINRFTLKKISNGSLDEYYPGERSFPATAFTSYALLKSSLLLSDEYVLSSTKLSSIVKFLLDRNVSKAANQDIAAASFLWLYYLNIKKTDEVLDQIKIFLRDGEPEFSFFEYYGFDFGYSTVSLNYLFYMLDDGYVNAIKSIKIISKLLAASSSNSCVVSGTVFSRNTSYWLPYGILRLSYYNQNFSSLLRKCFHSNVVNIIDDRYLAHYFSPSIASAALVQYEDNKLFSDIDFCDIPSYFVSGGIVFVRFDETVVLISLLKNGVLSVNYNGKYCYVNNGYVALYKSNYYSSGNIDISDAYDNYKITKDKNGVIVVNCRGDFSRYSVVLPTPIKTIILRMSSFLGGYLNDFFKEILIKKTLKLRRSNFYRDIYINTVDKSISLRDRVIIPDFTDIFSASNFSQRLVPSSKFYSKLDTNRGMRKISFSSEIKTNVYLGNGNEVEVEVSYE